MQAGTQWTIFRLEVRLIFPLSIFQTNYIDKNEPISMKPGDLSEPPEAFPEGPLHELTVIKKHSFGSRVMPV